MARSYLQDIPETRFTESTIREMYRLVDAAKTDEKFQKLIYSIVNGAMPGQWKDYRRELDAILSWVRAHVDYRRDPYGVELLQDVWATLDRKRADCDDFSILMASAAEVLGAPSRFITISTKPDREPSHVYIEVNVGGAWTPIDAIMQWATVGWSPTEGVTARKVWERTDVGLAGYGGPIEGLGMHEWTETDVYRGNGHQLRSEEGFAAGDQQVFNPTGFPNDISMTYAPGVPGEVAAPGRFITAKEMSPVSDPLKMQRAGNGVYEYPKTVESYRDGSEVYSRTARADVPTVFDPAFWAGPVPTWRPNPDALLPHPLSAEGQMLSGLGDISSGADAIGQSIVSQVNAGIVPNEPSFIQRAIDAAVGIWAKSQEGERAEAEAERLKAEAELARAKASMLPRGTPDVPFYKQSWFLPVAGAASFLLLKTGFLGGGGKRYRRNPAKGIEQYLPLAAGGALVYWLATKKASARGGAPSTASPAALTPIDAPRYEQEVAMQQAIDIASQAGAAPISSAEPKSELDRILSYAFNP